MNEPLTTDPVTDKKETIGLECTLPDGGVITGYLEAETESFYWIFKRNGRTTRIRLSANAVWAMAQIAENLLDPKENAA